MVPIVVWIMFFCVAGIFGFVAVSVASQDYGEAVGVSLKEQFSVGIAVIVLADMLGFFFGINLCYGLDFVLILLCYYYCVCVSFVDVSFFFLSFSL